MGLGSCPWPTSPSATSEIGIAEEALASTASAGASRSRPRNSSRLCPSVLPKPIPGSTHTRLGSTPAATAASIATEPMSDENKIARMLSEGLEVSPVKDTKIVSIGYSDANPAMAQMITNAVVRAYMDEMLEIKLASSSYQLTWMTDKAEQEREKLERAERALQLAQEELGRYTRGLEKQVEERTREITSILRYTPDVVSIKDRDGHYTLINTCF